MSYILDALARAHISRSSEISMRALSKRALLQRIAIGVLLALVVLLGTAYVESRRNERAKSPATPEVSQARSAPAAMDVPSMAPRPSRQVSAPATTASASPMAVATTRSAGQALTRAAEPTAAVRFSPPIALSQPLPGPSPRGPGGAYVASRSPPAGMVAAPPAAREATRTVALAELKPLSTLPPDVRASIAQMKVRVLFYAPQPRSRFVMIDGRELREGDELFDGVRLEEITDNGLVIRHKNMLVLSPATASP